MSKAKNVFILTPLMKCHTVMKALVRSSLCEITLRTKNALTIDV